jgi:uncharacterized membrane protein
MALCLPARRERMTTMSARFRCLMALICCSLAIQSPVLAHQRHAAAQAARTIETSSDSASERSPRSAASLAPTTTPVATASVEIVPRPVNAFLDVAADLHSAIIHFPIAWVVLLFLLETWALVRRRPAPEAGMPLALLAALSFLPAAATGLIHAGLMAAAPPLSDLIAYHRSLALTGASLMVLAAGLRLGLRFRPSPGLRAGYLAVLVMVLVLCLAAGHQGGLVVRSHQMLD